MKFFIAIAFTLLIIVSQAQTDVYFAFGKSTLTKEAKKVLDSLKRSFKSNDVIQLTGYADTTGTMQSNMNLSEERVISVKKHLNKNGNPASIEIYFKGEISPKYTTNSKNRRVEIYPLKGEREIEILEEIEGEITTLTVQQFLEKDQINLKNIQFKPGTAEFYNQAVLNELRQLRSILSELSTIKIVIEGHVCCTNDKILSELRAKKVYWYLLDNGISKERISIVGYSNMRPLLPETSAYNNQQNRRVEVRIIER